MVSSEDSAQEAQSQDTAWEAPQSLHAQRSGGPTVQRLVLGGHLRRLRDDAGMTTEQAAAAIRGSHSKISRMELGRVGFKERDIADLLTLYGVAAGEEREALLKLSREANTPGWWQGYSDILPHWVEPYFGLEAAAAFIRNYQLQFVPGLLQTEDYARALIRARQRAGRGRHRAPRRGAALPAGRAHAGERRRDLWTVMDEGALRRPIGGTEVMRDQLRHLIEMCDHPAVTLQILPFRTGAHPAMGGPFTILRFAEPDLRDVVYIEQLTSALYLDKPTEVDSYLEVMEQVCLQAEPCRQDGEPAQEHHGRPVDRRFVTHRALAWASPWSGSPCGRTLAVRTASRFRRSGRPVPRRTR